MRRNILKFICFVFINLQLSCDPTSSFDARIENNSGKTVILKVNSEDSTILKPNECKCDKNAHLGNYDDYRNGSYIPCGKGKLYVLDTNYTITKDIGNCDNWEKSNKKHGKGGDFFCRFTLTDADIEKKK